jgi:hypothetical protein
LHYFNRHPSSATDLFLSSINPAGRIGERSGAWIKLRTNMEQEFVIGGYIPGARGFDALLVGVYENKRLIFVAKVKNGFVPRIRDELFPTLKALQTAQCPFKNLPEKRASRWGESLTGMKLDKEGNLFASGPGGILVFAPDGTYLGSIEFDVRVSNCAWVVTAPCYSSRQTLRSIA